MDDNIINFPRIGFSPGSPRPAGDAGDPPPAGFAWAPASGSRRSPLDTLAALPAPGLTRPVIPEPGFVPDTFRAEPVGDVSGPHLSALSLAAILAVSVAALRGIHSAVTAYRASREQRKTVADLAGGAAAKDGSKKKIPSGAEYGHKSLGRTFGGGGGSKKSASGSGSSGISSGGSKGSSSGGRKPSAKSPSTDGSKTGGSSKTNSPNKPKRPGPVHRTTQGGGTGSPKHKKNKPSADMTGSDSRKRSNGNAGGGKDKKGRVKSPRGTSGPKGLLRSMKNRKADKNGPTSSPLTKGKKGAMPPGGAKPSKVRSPKSSGGKRTKLSEAIGKEFGRRLKRRRKNMTKPPIWTARKAKVNTKGPTSKQAGAPKSAGKAKGQTRSTGDYWGKVRSRARAHWGKRRAAWSTTSAGPSTGPSSGPSGAGPSAGTRTRRTPWESAGMTTGTDATTTVVYRADKPNPHAAPAPALGVAVPSLPAAPTPHTKRPGTRRPIPMPPAVSTPRTPMSTPARRVAGHAMDPQHATEVTLDDALDVLEQLTRESFGTHDECVGLAHKARVIRDQLALLAADLRTTHNVIGGLTAGAMTRLAESMDILARKADEMQTTSLEAAETSEAADNSLNDAYRPITQATVDAGLTVPSARIHNEG